jgi:hypothetical protein
MIVAACQASRVDPRDERPQLRIQLLGRVGVSQAWGP